MGGGVLVEDAHGEDGERRKDVVHTIPSQHPDEIFGHFSQQIFCLCLLSSISLLKTETVLPSSSCQTLCSLKSTFNKKSY